MWDEERCGKVLEKVWESVSGCGKSSLKEDVERGVKSVLGCGGGKARSEGAVGKCWGEM